MVAAKGLMWILTFGAFGYGAFLICKPDDETLSKLDESSKHTSARSVAKDTLSVIQQAATPGSDIDRKIDELLKKGK